MKRDLFKKFIAFILLSVIVTAPVSAEKKVKLRATMATEHSIKNETTEVKFVTNQEVKILNDITIPGGATVTAKVYQAQAERRWHKSGYFICQITEYTFEDETIDITDKEIYLVARKYEAINKKDATILGSEIVLTQAASIVGSCFIYFAPVDIVYFFTKGAIQREKNPNWFKAGVSNAYDNSIFWFWLKGKPIELENGDSVKLKKIKKKKAEKIIKKLDKKYTKQKAKTQKKLDKKLKKQQKKELKEMAKAPKED